MTDWSDHHILLAMSRRGEDLPGNLIVGEESFARWQALGNAPSTRNDYPALADASATATADTLDAWEDARGAARQFWAQARDDARLSDDARSFCASHVQRLAQ